MHECFLWTHRAAISITCISGDNSMTLTINFPSLNRTYWNLSSKASLRLSWGTSRMNAHMNTRRDSKQFLKDSKKQSESACSVTPIQTCLKSPTQKATIFQLASLPSVVQSQLGVRWIPHTVSMRLTKIHFCQSTGGLISLISQRLTKQARLSGN